MNLPMSDEKEAYDAIKNIKDKFGTFHKTCFHIHTPASYDYRMLNEWTHVEYENASEQDLYQICIDQKVFPKILSLDDILLKDVFACYSNKKELLSYILIAEKIIDNEIELVLVTDHHTIEGFPKLVAAIGELYKMKKPKVYPMVICGVEISCADKNHIVGIFEYNSHNIDKISKWLRDNLLSVKEGSFKTSLEVLEYIKSINGIGYIAHIDTSEIFNEKYLSGAYKRKLLSKDELQIVGISNYGHLDYIKDKIKTYRSSEVKFIIDNDAHDIDAISKNAFWIKGSNRGYSMLKEAFNDYDISVSFEKQELPAQYIRGLYIKNRKESFLCGKNDLAFCLSFSNALNCLIGGRGTGKSTVLELMEYILSQRCIGVSELDFICSLGNSWLLYEYHGDEYFLEMRMPIKSDPSDNILHYFGQNPSNRYSFKYIFNQEDIRIYALQHYFKISKVVYVDDTLYLEPITRKRETLNRFFDVRYSVNELVNTATGGEKINDFLYETLFKNKVLSKPDDIIRVRKKSGLIKILSDVQSVMQKRKEEVDEVIIPFNKSQNNILRIVYSQEGKYLEPDLAGWLFKGKYFAKGWYKKYNITEENLVGYLLKIYSELGIFEFLKLVVNEDTDKTLSVANIMEFCTEMNQSMVELGVNSLNKIDELKFMKETLRSLITDENIEIVLDYLKEYIVKAEKFTLEFNINNKEGGSGSLVYKLVSRLSLGQKVVAMLSFVLGYSEYSKDYRPLIIDQPEDNLDNQYIYKNLVKQLRTIKDKRQVIIATHNATIVTNAKADQVCIMRSDNQHGWVETTGYPGEIRIKKRIINYLEGGKESFLHKISIYEYALEIKNNK